MAVAPAAAPARIEAVGLISSPWSAGWPEQHRQPRHGDSNGESFKQDWVHGLKIEPAELTFVLLSIIYVNRSLTILIELTNNGICVSIIALRLSS